MRERSGVLITARVLAMALVASASLRVAWVSDDALITLRTLLNLSHGWGPGFNATEHVQAYTHPLWFLIWLTVGSATNQWILGMLALSVLLTAAAVGILVWRTTSLARILLVTGLLVLSNAFIEYSTSGLENPLAYLTAGAFVALTTGGRLVASEGAAARTWFVAPALAGLLVAAIALTRLDLIVLIAPVILALIVLLRRQWRIIMVAAAAAVVPLIAWFAWSQVTYSSWLPNTFLAKRNVDIPATELVIQGFRYLWVTFEHDPVTLVALIVGVTMGLTMGSLIVRAWAIGVLLYVGYVVWIGGDFMAGRFLAVPVYIAAFLIVLSHRSTERDDDGEQPVREQLPALAASAGAVALLLVASVAAASTPTALANTQEPRWTVDQNINAGVSDERGVYVGTRSLKGLIDNLSLAYLTPNIVPIGDGKGLNRSLREIDKAAKEWPDRPDGFTNPSEVGVFCGFLGTVGIATGPITHLIDACALTDRYLASMPYVPSGPFAWKPGHFERELPAGYQDAVANDDPSRVQDPRERFRLEQLWAEIR